MTGHTPQVETSSLRFIDLTRWALPDPGDGEGIGEEDFRRFVVESASIDGHVTYRGDGGVSRSMIDLYDGDTGLSAPWRWKSGLPIDDKAWIQDGVITDVAGRLVLGE